MKKLLSILLALCLTLSLMGCGADGSHSQTVNQGQTVKDILDRGGTASTGNSGAKSAAAAAWDDTVYDVDLTVMNSTMVYSEVYQMMQNPESYLGKTMKMAGTMAIYQGEERNYSACIIADATACCAQGIEFLWNGQHDPAEYPSEGTEITVTGVFDTYYEGSIQYCQLIDAELYF